MFPHKFRLLILIVGIVFLLVGSVLVVSKHNFQTQNVNEVASYEECVRAGYPVLESYPPQCKTETGKSFTQDIGNELELRDVISIENPRPNQKISSPLVIKGRARGTFYFEGTFPIRLVDKKGTTIAEGFVVAQGEWMTEDFVPFIGELQFQTDTTSGRLYLEKSNPSGLLENEQILEIPVIF